MSVQKLIAEAEKLLEKKKSPEAIEKLRSALKLDPMNQLVTSRLAAIYVDAGDTANAAKAYVDLGGRLSEMGKSSIAIAVYKQAVDLVPNDPATRLRYARECEYMNKVSDATAQANTVFKYYLRRKRSLDAIDMLPLLVRLQPKDDQIKMIWADLVLHAHAEQKLIHLLVALCGPPGLVSAEFPMGGDATALADGIYEFLKQMLAFFPREPRFPYALAWAAYRKDRRVDFYLQLKESLRRDPDFSLAPLLFARSFAEAGKKREAFFVFKYAKERISSDRSVEAPVLLAQFDALTSKYAWLLTPDELGPEIEPAAFKNLLAGLAPELPSAPMAAPAVPTPATDTPTPAEIATVSVLAESPAAEEAEMATAPKESVEFTGLIQAPILAEGEEAPPEMPAEAMEAVEGSTREFQPPSAHLDQPPPAPNAPRAGFNPLEVMESQAIAKVQEEREERTEMFSPLDLLNASNAKGGPAGVQTKLIETEIPPPPPLAAGGPPAHPPGLFVEGEATMMFSPFEAVQAVSDSRKVAEGAVGAPPPAPPRFAPPEPEAPPPPPAPAAPAEVAHYVAGEATMMFSPFEAVQATEDSRRPPSSPAAAPPVAPATPPVPTAPPVVFIAVPPAPAAREPEAEAATMVMQMPAEPAVILVPSPPPVPSFSPVAPPPSPSFDAADAGDATMVMPRPAAPSANDDATRVMDPSQLPAAENFGGEYPPPFDPAPLMAENTAGETNASILLPPPVIPVVQFVPIPTFAKKEEPALTITENKGPTAAPVMPYNGERSKKVLEEVPEEIVDLGEDLLQEPTRNLVLSDDFISTERESTRHLLQEIKQELRERKNTGAPDADSLVRRAERYVVKKNYYLARKALRHALALGANEDRVKNRLREIRRLERPESLYHSASSDEANPTERADEILSRLEDEFGLHEDAEATLEEEALDAQLAKIVAESDSRELLDFGIALHEMGLFRQAESLFSGLVESAPEFAFDAYYLAATAKTARRDYAGAASILKKLSDDSGKTEAEKIQVYYALAEVFEKMQRQESSREFYQKVAKLDANYRNVRHKLAPKAEG